MHTLGPRLRARAALSSSGKRGDMRLRCLSLFTERPAALSLPRRRLRQRNPVEAATSTTMMPPRHTTARKNASQDSARVAAVTDDDFPRVLNGPAPGYAEDALRRLLFCALPSEKGQELSATGGKRGLTIELNTPGLMSQQQHAEEDVGWRREGEGGGWRTAEELLPGHGEDDGGAAAAASWDNISTGCDEGKGREGGREDLKSSRHHFQRQHQKQQTFAAAGRNHVGGGSWRGPQNHQAFSSAPELVDNGEYGDYGDGLESMASSHVEEGPGGAEEERRRLPYSTLWTMQLAREEQSHQEACDKYAQTLKKMMATGKASHMKPVERMLCSWYPKLKERIEAEQAAVWANKPDDDKFEIKRAGAFGGRNTYGPLLVMLKADKQAVLVMHEVVNLILAEGNKGVSTLKACIHVAELVQAEVNLLKMKENGKMKQTDVGVELLPVSGRRHVKALSAKTRDALDSLDYQSWPLGAQVKLGAALIRFLLESACWTTDAEGEGVVAWDDEKGVQEGGLRTGAGETLKPKPAFIHNVVTDRKLHRQGYLSLAPEVFKKMVDEDVARLAAPRHVPMLVPPQDWTRPNRGGFLRLHCQIMRTKGLRAQKESLKKADLTKVYEGLNCLGKVAWCINTEVLGTVVKCLEEKIAVGDLPTADDIPVPPPPEGVLTTSKGGFSIPKREHFESDEAHKKAFKTMVEHRRMVTKIKTRNANMHSLRCDMKIKVGIAQEFRDHVFYFPYNMDFRGRTYPIPPNLNILGSDFSRGVLMFEESKPLGENGLHWLKVHLANLYGEDKVSFDDRVTFVEKRLHLVRDSAERPLEGEGWWKEADSPWQCLAVCKDLIAALDSPDPSQYHSRLPVHQDGSCNGLQHYAALGLDAKGGAQVNLVPADKPGDVYTGVCNIVKQKVSAEAQTVPDPSNATEEELESHRLAKLVDGLIDRKVVKQTVMTSVYGVTFVGARKQIQNVLGERLLAGTEVPTVDAELDTYKAAAYVARHTMTVLEELFTEARNTMEWLMAVSNLVAKEGQPMAWITPLGLPVVQPYRRRDTYQVQTLLQGVHIREEREDVPVSVVRQKSAFPPNFVHSLDSTHMLLTAVEMTKAGMAFAAVHDSYWVHAGNVDRMNWQLRQCFVDLYSGPILEDLYESLQMRYPTINFPPIPERGTLKLKDVKKSKYFFN